MVNFCSQLVPHSNIHTYLQSKVKAYNIVITDYGHHNFELLKHEPHKQKLPLGLKRQPCRCSCNLHKPRVFFIIFFKINHSTRHRFQVVRAAILSCPTASVLQVYTSAIDSTAPCYHSSLRAYHVSQSTSGRYTVYHVVLVSLSNTHVLYTMRLSFEYRLIIYACPSICPSVAFQTVTAHLLKNMP